MAEKTSNEWHSEGLRRVGRRQKLDAGAGWEIVLTDGCDALGVDRGEYHVKAFAGHGPDKEMVFSARIPSREHWTSDVRRSLGAGPALVAYVHEADVQTALVAARKAVMAHRAGAEGARS
jgi:hypothetical protein